MGGLGGDERARRGTPDGGVEHLDGVRHPHRVPGPLDRGGDLHQAARVGGDQHLGPGRDDVGGLAVAQLAGRLGVDDVVDARRAAAQLGLGDLLQRQAGDRLEQPPRLGADALGVREVAGVVVGDRSSRAGAAGPPGRARRGSPRRRGPSRRRRAPGRRTPGRRPAGRRTPSSWSRSRRRSRRPARRRWTRRSRRAGGRSPAPPPPGRCAPTARRSSPGTRARRRRSPRPAAPGRSRSSRRGRTRPARSR